METLPLSCPVSATRNASYPGTASLLLCFPCARRGCRPGRPGIEHNVSTCRLLPLPVRAACRQTAEEAQPKVTPAGTMGACSEGLPLSSLPHPSWPCLRCACREAGTGSCRPPSHCHGSHRPGTPGGQSGHASGGRGQQPPGVSAPPEAGWAAACSAA